MAKSDSEYSDEDRKHCRRAQHHLKYSEFKALIDFDNMKRQWGYSFSLMHQILQTPWLDVRYSGERWKLRESEEKEEGILANTEEELIFCFIQCQYLDVVHWVRSRWLTTWQSFARTRKRRKARKRTKRHQFRKNDSERYDTFWKSWQQSRCFLSCTLDFVLAHDLGSPQRQRKKRRKRRKIRRKRRWTQTNHVWKVLLKQVSNLFVWFSMGHWVLRKRNGEAQATLTTVTAETLWAGAEVGAAWHCNYFWISCDQTLFL